MSYNHNYKQQQRQKWLDNKRSNEDWYMTESKKKKRKSLSKRLKMQQNGGRYVHVLDDEMVDNLCNMLKSIDDDDIALAKEIVFKSKMSNDHITRFVNEHLDILLGYTYSNNPRMTIYSNGHVGIGNAYSSHSLSISGTSTATVSTSGYISSGTSTNNAVTYTYTI
jgi:hypothetical protein